MQIVPFKECGNRRINNRTAAMEAAGSTVLWKLQFGKQLKN